MFIPTESWDLILEQALRHWHEELPFYSPGQKKVYYIAGFSNKTKLRIWSIRDAKNTQQSISSVQVENFIEELERSGGRMPANRYEMPGSALDVMPIATIVHLHPWLDYDEKDGMMEIIIRNTPKMNIPGTATFSPESEEQLQKAARDVRKGQGPFRNRLRELYSDQCCISRTNVEAVLDAAHIIPYSLNGATEEANGLLLRSDIHNLFDDGLIEINPQSLVVRISKSLQLSTYWQFNGVKLLDRIDGSRPSENALNQKINLHRN